MDGPPLPVRGPNFAISLEGHADRDRAGFDNVTPLVINIRNPVGPQLEIPLLRTRDEGICPEGATSDKVSPPARSGASCAVAARCLNATSRGWQGDCS